jgi:hypothetical protein
MPNLRSGKRNPVQKIKENIPVDGDYEIESIINHKYVTLPDGMTEVLAII